jgi:hypothetical protein
MRHLTRMRMSLAEFVRGELPPDEAARVEQHLASCLECRAECEQLADVFRSIPLRPTPPSDSQPGEYWQTFARRVDARIAEQRMHHVQFRTPLDAIIGYLRMRWKPIVISAGAGALVVGILGIWLLGGHEHPIEVQETRDVNVMPVGQREEVDDYFERSRILLIGIANIPADEGDKIDLSVERRAARDLVHTARYLEKKPIDSRSRDLIRQLERVLVELANLEEQADIPDVDVIRSGVQQQNLLFKIRMVEDRKR